MDNDLALLHEKLDHLTEMVEHQQQRLAQVEDLAAEVMPLAPQMLQMATNELADIGDAFQPADLVVLIKRVLRDTRLLTDLLGSAEAAVELAGEVLPLTQQMVVQAIAVAEQLEAKGFVGLARGGYAVAEKVAANYTEADLRALADSLPAALDLVRQATRPELLRLANDAVTALSAPPEPVSLWQLVGVVFDAKLRQGLGRMLKLVKVMAN
jgi:uncharacterized protein YjgD (DUF1641 family)